MKKLILVFLSTVYLTGCFEDVDNSLGRDSFLGNYEMVLNCTGSHPSSSHIIFIEKPVGGADTLNSLVIIRNLINQNQAIQAVVSQSDIIFNDDTILGTGSLSDDTNQLSLSISFRDNDCTGQGIRK